jgi:hypothetical protein
MLEMGKEWMLASSDGLELISVSLYIFFIIV